MGKVTWHGMCFVHGVRHRKCIARGPNEKQEVGRTQSGEARMQYLIILSALLSLVTAVIAQDVDTKAGDGDEASAMESVDSGELTSAMVAE